MNILNKISIKNLKLNKKRTISTIIGIILSVALICAVASMGVSFQETLIQNAINETGYYHIRILSANDNDIKTFENNRDIDKIYKVKNCGYSKLEESKNESKKYLKLFSMDEDCFKNLKFNLIEGHFPNNSNEVIISKHIMKNAKVDLKIGDTLNLEVGERRSQDNFKLNPDNYYEQNEKLVNTKYNTVKVVGIIERPNYGFEEYSDPGYTIITTGIEFGENDIYMSLKSPKDYKESLTQLLGADDYEELKSHDIEISRYNYGINNELLRWEVFAFSDSTVNMLYSVIGIVIFIIIFTSIFCIRNSFAIATTEKIKMYSMLASVGTTKRQIRKNVITEGLIYGLIGIPIGIISGFFAVWILLKIVNLLLGKYLLTYVDGLIFKISALPILLSIVLGFITIYLSSLSSARKASRVSPIEGLRSSNDIKLTNKKLKVPKIISKLFKEGGVLAYKNLKRSKKKYRTTVISIAVSIFIFITMNTFISNMFDLTGNYYEDFEYNMKIYLPEDNKDELNKILSLDNIESYNILYNFSGGIKIKDLSKIIEIPNSDIELVEDGYYDEELDEFISNGEKYSALEFVALDSQSFKRYVKKIGLDYDKIGNKGILCDDYRYQDLETGSEKEIRRYNYSKGDFIEGETDSGKIKIEVGEITDIKPYGLEKSYYGGGYLVVNSDKYKDLDFHISYLSIQSDDTEKLESELKLINDDIRINNLEATVKEEKSMSLVIKIFLYGFIAVISLIGVTNIFNTITSNMELRQKEFAMLKSIGMTKREFNRMINLETIFYGTKAFIYGVILGLIGTFAMYKAFAVKLDSGIYIPYNAIIISAVFVFLLVFVIMRYSMSRINKQNIIETVRKENI